MPTPYPTNDQEFEAWLTTYLANIGAVMTALGLPATYDDALIAAKATFSTALTAHTASQVDSFAKRTAKDAAKEAAFAALRVSVNPLRANPAFTDAHATSLGLQIYDTTPTDTDPGMEAPTLEVDTSSPQSHTISFWQMSEEDAKRTAKPEWARACRIVRAIVDSGDACPPIEGMSYVASDTASPYVATYAGIYVSKDAWYRGAWETPTGEMGPWSAPAKGTITG